MGATGATGGASDDDDDDDADDVDVCVQPMHRRRLAFCAHWLLEKASRGCACLQRLHWRPGPAEEAGLGATSLGSGT